MSAFTLLAATGCARPQTRELAGNGPMLQNRGRTIGFGLDSLQGNEILLDYIQSGFAAGHSYGPVGAITRTPETKLGWTRILAKRFMGSEAIITDLRRPEHRQDIRDLSAAFKQVSQENGKPFYGYYIVPRSPGFHFDEEIAAQPANYRSSILRSDGALLQQKPDVHNLISITGQIFDVTNSAAVEDYLAQMKKTFRAECVPVTDCVGPLFGFIAYNENKLSEAYNPFPKSPNELGAYHDLWPTYWDKTQMHERYENLRAGHPFSLMIDADPAFHFLHPPKRAVPLFSKKAAESFVAYARSRGHTRMTKLPADRGEFNDREDPYNGEPRLKQRVGDPLGPDGWVQFVPLSDAEYWGVWEEWTHEVWTGFMLRLAQTFAEAQAGNPDYKGVIYFQLPSWYSIRGKAASEAISYKDGNGVSHSMRLIDSPYYKGNNPAVMGVDMARIVQSPYIAGVLHETTNALPIYFPKTTAEQVNREVYNSPIHQEVFLAKGFALKKLAHENGKIFGAFAQYDNWVYGGQMSQSLYKEYAWDKTLHILKPDMVSTLPGFYYTTQDDVAGTQFAWNANQPDSQTFGHIWLQELAKLRAALAEQPQEPPVPGELELIWMQPGKASFGPAEGITIAGRASGSRGNVAIRYRVAGGSWVDLAYQSGPGADGIWYNSIPLQRLKDERPYEIEATYGGTRKVCVGGVWDGATGGAKAVQCSSCTLNAYGQTQCPSTPIAGDFGPPVKMEIYWMQPGSTSWGPANGITVAGIGGGGEGGVKIRYRLSGAAQWTLAGYEAPPSGGNWSNSVPLRFPKDTASFELEAEYSGRVDRCSGSIWNSLGQALEVNCTSCDLSGQNCTSRVK